LTDHFRGHDPVSGAAARAINLISLDELAEAALQTRMLDAADRAAVELVTQLLEDTYVD
jgi:hypothetical protein